MTTGLTVGTLMDQIAPFDDDTHVVTDTGDVIFTIAAEHSTTSRSPIAAMTSSAHDTAPISVDEIRAMFAYYNVDTPRSRKANGPCRDSPILLRPMSNTVRHIAGIEFVDDTVILQTEPTNEVAPPTDPD